MQELVRGEVEICTQGSRSWRFWSLGSFHRKGFWWLELLGYLLRQEVEQGCYANVQSLNSFLKSDNQQRLWGTFSIAASLLAATSTKSDPWAQCLKLLVTLLGVKWLSTPIAIIAKFQEKQICSMNRAAYISLRAIVSDSLQTQGNSKVTVVCMLKG